MYNGIPPVKKRKLISDELDEESEEESDELEVDMNSIKQSTTSYQVNISFLHLN